MLVTIWVEIDGCVEPEAATLRWSGTVSGLEAATKKRTELEERFFEEFTDLVHSFGPEPGSAAEGGRAQPSPPPGGEASMTAETIVGLIESRGLLSLRKSLKAKEILTALGLTPKKRGEAQRWTFSHPGGWQERCTRDGRAITHSLRGPGGSGPFELATQAAKLWRVALENVCGKPTKDQKFFVYKIPDGGRLVTSTYDEQTESGHRSLVIQTTARL